MLHYNDYAVKNAKEYYNQMLRNLEIQADAIGYSIDKDATYIQACSILTDIELHNIEPLIETWISLGMYYGYIQSRINSYKGGRA